MGAILITNIKQLVNVRKESHLLRGKELADLPCIQNAYLIIEGDEIAEYGEMKDFKPVNLPTGRHTRDKKSAINASGQFILPTWCDSHTHLVFAGSREDEFVDKIKGLSYAEIASRGGGILRSAKTLNETSEDELFLQAWKRLEEVSRLGTGAVEIKSGYGLCLEGELKMLRVIKKLKGKTRLSLKATFLGAHAYPHEYKDDHKGYIDILTEQMMPVIARDQLADYIDVFCETGFFSASETEIICLSGMRYGLKPKIHANQLTLSGGVQVGVKLGAVSVDHLEKMDEDAINTLKKSNTIGTLLPAAAFFLRMPYQPARQLIDAGCAVALASDFNPGSAPSGNINTVIAISCIQMGMLPEEAVNAATLNGAFAMESAHELGTIFIGKKANLIFLNQFRPLLICRIHSVQT